MQRGQIGSKQPYQTCIHQNQIEQRELNEVSRFGHEKPKAEKYVDAGKT